MKCQNILKNVHQNFLKCLLCRTVLDDWMIVTFPGRSIQTLKVCCAFLDLSHQLSKP